MPLMLFNINNLALLLVHCVWCHENDKCLHQLNPVTTDSGLSVGRLWANGLSASRSQTPLSGRHQTALLGNVGAQLKN